MKNKKGLTLIELLAVIVVLAILALITIPVISNVIDNVRIKSLQNSAYGLIEASNLYYISKGNNTTIRFDKNDTKDTLKELSYKGVVKIGTVIIDKKGKVTVCITDGKNSAYKNYNETRVTTVKGKVCNIPSNTSIVYLDDDATITEYSLSELTELVNELRDDVSNLKEKNETLSSKNEELKSELSTLNSNLNSQISTLSSSISTNISNISQNASNISSLTTNLNNVSNGVSDVTFNLTNNAFTLSTNQIKRYGNLLYINLFLTSTTSHSGTRLNIGNLTLPNGYSASGISILSACGSISYNGYCINFGTAWHNGNTIRIDFPSSSQNFYDIRISGIINLNHT